MLSKTREARAVAYRNEMLARIAAATEEAKRRRQDPSRSTPPDH